MYTVFCSITNAILYLSEIPCFDPGQRPAVIPLIEENKSFVTKIDLGDKRTCVVSFRLPKYANIDITYEKGECVNSAMDISYGSSTTLVNRRNICSDNVTAFSTERQEESGFTTISIQTSDEGRIFLKLKLCGKTEVMLLQQG